MSDKIKILLVDDHDLVRAGIRSILELKPNTFEVLGEVTNGESAIEFVEKVVPDVILMDVNMPRMNGIETTRNIIEKFPDVKIIALSLLSESQHIKEMTEAGAKGYLLKNTSPDTLFAGIENLFYTK